MGDEALERRAPWRVFRGRITGWPVLAVIPVTAFQQIRLDTQNLGWTAPEAARVGAISLIGFALVTALAWWLTRGRTVNLITGAAVWAVATAVRIGLVVVVPLIAGLPGPRPIAQYPGLALTTFTVALASWVITERQHEHAQTVRRLRQRQAVLERRVAQDSVRLDEVREQVFDAIETQVQPVRDACAVILSQPTDASTRTDITALLDVQVQQVLRPTSQTLLTSSDSAPAEESVEIAQPKRVGLGFLSQQSWRAEVIRPWWPIVTVAVFTALILGNVEGVATPLALYLEGVAITSVAMIATWALWRAGVRPRPGWPAPWLGALLLYTLAGVLTAVGLQVIPLGRDTTPVTLYLLLIVVSGCAGSFLFALREQQRVVRANLAAAAEATEQLDTRLRREVWFERRRLAAVLHGRVQSRLLAAAAHLSHDAHNPASVEEVRHHIAEASEALASLRDSGTGKLEDPLSALEEIASMWATSMRVDIEASADDLDQLRPATVAAILDIVTEAVLNARKHGDAEYVRVEIRRVDGDAEITVTDDGIGISEPSHAGSGTEFLDTMSADWTFTDTPDGGAKLYVMLTDSATDSLHSAGH